MVNAKTRYSVKNTDKGPRGFYTDGNIAFVDAGQSVTADMTDADKAAAEAGDYFEFTAIEGGPPQADYERDDLGKVDIHKPSTDKATLLVIAAYEQAEVPEGDATKAELIKAIEAKRKG